MIGPILLIQLGAMFADWERRGLKILPWFECQALTAHNNDLPAHAQILESVGYQVMKRRTSSIFLQKEKSRIQLTRSSIPGHIVFRIEDRVAFNSLSPLIRCYEDLFRPEPVFGSECEEEGDLVLMFFFKPTWECVSFVWRQTAIFPGT